MNERTGRCAAQGNRRRQSTGLPRCAGRAATSDAALFRIHDPDEMGSERRCVAARSRWNPPPDTVKGPRSRVETDPEVPLSEVRLASTRT